MSESDRPATTEPEAEVEVGMTIDQLPIEARLRLEHAEKWVAWAEDWQSVIASGDDHAEVREAARLAGFPRATMEWVPPPYRSCWSPQRLPAEQ
jgi:hypothetical protein